jgi:DNA recombination protein Rad52
MKPGIFTELQVEALNGSLSAQVVKQREQSGRKLSYVEGWWVIREMNRIFGFDAWTQDIIEIKCVNQTERKIGKFQKDGWGVSYIARVKLTIKGTDGNQLSVVSREGVGSGHGIDVDLGLAHESAIKEAATDAMKRAAMTFGNPFGLALYDKDQRSVEDTPPSEMQVSEAEKVNADFVERLTEKMQEVGIQKTGAKTLMVILGIRKWEDTKEKIRSKLIENLTPAYAQKLNAGQNSKGDQIIDISVHAEAPSISDLQAAAKEALNV